jgi:hypothetical protein
MLDPIRKRLVDDWRQAWRWSTVRFHALMLLLAGVYEIMPALSPQIAAMLPAAHQAKAIGVYALIGLLLRLTKMKSNGAG